MSWEYSENILVQNSAGKVLSDKLGWDVILPITKKFLAKTVHSAELHIKKLYLRAICAALSLKTTIG